MTHEPNSLHTFAVLLPSPALFGFLGASLSFAALSPSSPFYHGRHTGIASDRLFGGPFSAEFAGDVASGAGVSPPNSAHSGELGF